MYGKVFAQIYDGSLYGQWEALVTFQQLIVLADRDGTVDMTPEAIAARTSIPLVIIQRGLASLAAADPRSRTPDEEGRRIVLLDDHRDWGWRITNHKTYTAIRTAEERREYFKQYKRRQRAAAKHQPPPVHNVHHESSDSTNVAVAVDRDLKATTLPDGGKKRPPTWLTPYVVAWEAEYGVGAAATLTGRLAKALRPLHDAHGEARVVAQLGAYLAETEARYANPQSFAQRFSQWGHHKQPVSKQEQGRAHLQQWVTDGERASDSGDAGVVPRALPNPRHIAGDG